MVDQGAVYCRGGWWDGVACNTLVAGPMIFPDFEWKHTIPSTSWESTWSTMVPLSKEEADALAKLAEVLLRGVDTEQKENQQ